MLALKVGTNYVGAEALPGFQWWVQAFDEWPFRVGHNLSNSGHIEWGASLKWWLQAFNVGPWRVGPLGLGEQCEEEILKSWPNLASRKKCAALSWILPWSEASFLEKRGPRVQILCAPWSIYNDDIKLQLIRAGAPIIGVSLGNQLWIVHAPWIINNM